MCLLADRFARYCGTMYSRHLLWYPVHYLRRMVKSCISYIAPLGAASKRSIMLVLIFNTDPGRMDCSLHSSTFAAGRLERLLCWNACCAGKMEKFQAQSLAPSALGLFGFFLGFLPFSIFYRAFISYHHQKY